VQAAAAVAEEEARTVAAAIRTTVAAATAEEAKNTGAVALANVATDATEAAAITATAAAVEREALVQSVADYVAAPVQKALVCGCKVEFASNVGTRRAAVHRGEVVCEVFGFDECTYKILVDSKWKNVLASDLHIIE
jgi:hypothetical protein